MTQLPTSFDSALEIISSRLLNIDYCIRGTTSLVLQGIDMNVDDIDILCDAKSVPAINECLKDYCVDEISYKESPKFKSHFGKFLINDVSVEIMGDWQIFINKSNEWSKIYTTSERIKIIYNNLDLFVTPIKLELQVFAEMGRWAAYQKIKRQIL